MDKLLNAFVENPTDSLANYNLAHYYLGIQHYGGAVTHFMRCAEYSDINIEEEQNRIYESLIMLSRCLGALGNRKHSEEGWLLHAVSFDMDRPEAYWYLAMVYESQGKWQEMYTMTNLGLSCKKKALLPQYPGEYVLMFQKFYGAWWIGRTKEAREILFEMPDKYTMNERYISLVQANMNYCGLGKITFEYYTRSKIDELKIKFPGVEKIEKNFSQAYQDMFVLTMLNGKGKGYYLEIGSGDPFYVNNTWLLESQFEWNGISIDINAGEVEKFKKNRKNNVLCVDARQIRYDKFLDGIGAPENIDYLQIDCEPPQVNYQVLTSMPFDKYKFAVITFEHDHYADATRQYRDLSRNFLKEKGYLLVGDSLCLDGIHEFEDWWVHPEIVDTSIINTMLFADGNPKSIENFMLKRAFDWNPLGKTMAEGIAREIFDKKVYEYWEDVKQGDVVVDIGASVGPFTVSALKKGATKVYAVEPSEELMETIMRNTEEYSDKVVYINKAITGDDKEWVNVFCATKEFESVLFKDFIADNKIEKIDFLKIDCEGGEYDIFTEENIDFLTNKVGFIAAEFHLRCHGGRSKFRNFRNTILPYFKNYRIRSCKYQNISPGNSIDLKPYIESENWINTYNCEFMIYINNNNGFDWGEEYEREGVFKTDVCREIFESDVYQKFFKVEEGDIVVDIGASSGPFSYKIMKNKPAKVYCIEPCEKLFDTLKKNVPDAVCLNYGITAEDKKTDIQYMFTKNNDGTNIANGMKFSTFIKKYKIKKIDFMKIDCEEGEYDVFNDENFDWILKNVKKISGEFHLNNDEQKQKFRKFRDTYLKAFDQNKVEIYSYMGEEIKWGLWHDNFISYWGFIMIYIDNR